ncbi:MAG: serine/threonine-protein kinase [Phycisphaerae bacterium]
MNLAETITVDLRASSCEPAAQVEIPRRVGNVRINDLLGRGATGVVHAGFDEVLNRRVAVKILSQRIEPGENPLDSVMVAGVRAAARLRHPNIVGVHHVEVVDRVPIIVMEFVDGPALSAILQKDTGLDATLAVYALRKIADGVAGLHENHIVHRDLKPANVMYDRRGNCFVCDFGLACQIAMTARSINDERIAGSPLYMSPESFEGRISPQSDVYALGAMLFDLLCGGPPFNATTIEEIQKLHSEADVPLHRLLAKGVSEELCEIVARAMHKQRIMRFKTAAHLNRALAVFPPTKAAEIREQEKLIKLINQPRDATAEAKPTNASLADSPGNTFDLLAQRAKRKRASLDASGELPAE